MRPGYWLRWDRFKHDSDDQGWRRLRSDGGRCGRHDEGEDVPWNVFDRLPGESVLRADADPCSSSTVCEVIMKIADLQNASRILKLIRQLTAEELDAVEIRSDNADFNGQPDCSIYCRHWVGSELSESHFQADTLLDCLLQAIAARGLAEEPDPIFHIADTSAPVVCAGDFKPIIASADWSGDPSRIVPDLKAAVERAKADVGLRYEPGPVTIAAVRALEMWARCKAEATGEFSGGATTRFNVGDIEFELTIKPKRTGFAFIETADSIENDRAGEPQFGEPLSIEDELAAVLGMGSPVQDLRAEYASAYHRAHLEAIREVGRCEGCGITSEELKQHGGELNTHHEISVERIFQEKLNPGLIGDRKNLIVLCRNGGDECHFLIGHDDDGPAGRGPSWARSNRHVRRDASEHLARKKHARQSAEYFMDPDGDGEDIP